MDRRKDGDEQKLRRDGSKAYLDERPGVTLLEDLVGSGLEEGVEESLGVQSRVQHLQNSRGLVYRVQGTVQ